MPADPVEIARAAYQLSLDHGSGAHLYAEKLASKAYEKKSSVDGEFWSLVANKLRPPSLSVQPLQLEALIAPHLKKLGFRKKTRTWWLSNVETIGVINIQKSPYGENIYVNLGVYVKQLGQEERPPEYRCHVRARLEQVARTEFWNDIISADSITPPSPAMIEAVLQDGVSWLHNLATLDRIRDFVKSGSAQAVVPLRRLVGQYTD